MRYDSSIKIGIRGHLGTSVTVCLSCHLGSYGIKMVLAKIIITWGLCVPLGFSGQENYMFGYVLQMYSVPRVRGKLSFGHPGTQMAMWSYFHTTDIHGDARISSAILCTLRITFCPCH